MRVVYLGTSPAFEELVRLVVGPAASLERLDADRPGVEVDLAVVEASSATASQLALIRDRAGNAPLLMLVSGAPAKIRVQPVPRDLARMTYRVMMDLAGPHLVREYLEALLDRHHGNVTRSALAAGIERESLHRLLRRHGLRGRPSRAVPL